MDLSISTFIPKRKFPEPENMSAIDWAELILDFHRFCKETMNRIKTDDPEKSFSGEHIQGILCYSQNRHYQRINWRDTNLDLVIRGIQQEDSVKKIFRFCSAFGSGLSMFAIMNNEKDLFLCMATFAEAVRERDDKDDVYYARAVTVCPCTVENLAEALTETIHQSKEKTLKEIGQKFMKELCKVTISHFEDVQKDDMYSRIRFFKEKFGKEILSEYAT